MLVRIFYAYEEDFAFITISETDPSLSTALFSALHTKSCISSIICPYSLFNSARNFFVLIIIEISMYFLHLVRHFPREKNCVSPRYPEYIEMRSLSRSTCCGEGVLFCVSLLILCLTFSEFLRSSFDTSILHTLKLFDPNALLYSSKFECHPTLLHYGCSPVTPVFLLTLSKVLGRVLKTSVL